MITKHGRGILERRHQLAGLRAEKINRPTAIVVAEVIGTGVFLKARVMTCNVEYPWAVILVWILAGVLAMAGALTYGELTAMLPRAGGEYVFIREAYGRLAGFLFGWMRTFIGNTGGLAALAFGLGGRHLAREILERRYRREREPAPQDSITHL